MGKRAVIAPERLGRADSGGDLLYLSPSAVKRYPFADILSGSQKIEMSLVVGALWPPIYTHSTQANSFMQTKIVAKNAHPMR